MDNKIIAAVLVVVVVVAAVGVVYWFSTDDSESGDTYYFYLDGFESDIVGWHSAKGSDVASAFDNAMKDDGIGYKVDSFGMLTFDGYENSYQYDETKMVTTGVGIGIYVYTSVTLENPWPTYFVQGPVLKDVLGNIVYICYGEYEMTPMVTNHAVNPVTTVGSDLMTGGPFADTAYSPVIDQDVEYYYFYLDGFGDLSGWHSAKGTSIINAFDNMADAEGFEYTYSSGMLTIEDYIGTGEFDAETGTYSGIATGVFIYTPSTTDNPYAGYFGAGASLGDLNGNILYISYGEYVSPSTGWPSYSLNPLTTADEDLMSTGPFA